MSYRLIQQTKILFSIALIIVLSTVCAHAAEYMSVKKDGVNIRSGPDTKKEVRWEVFKNFPLKVLKHQGKWMQVQDFEGDNGWIFATLLTKQKSVIVKVKSANLRIGPGKNYESVASVKYGVVFKPLKKEGDWVKVKHEDGTTGWVFKTLIWPNDPF